MATTLALSDAVWNSIIDGVVIIVVTWIGMKLKDVAKTLVEVHKLANGGMADNLQTGMVSAATLAHVTKLPEHIALAEAAKTKYDAHMAVLAKENTP